ncbi:MAG: preprotein translocase subunit SecG [bacterium]
MYAFLIVIYLLVCFALTIVILLQSSKGGGLAGAFGGGGGMGAVFGGRGAATFLSRVTTGLAIAFLSLSLLISFLNRGSVGESRGLVEQEQERRSSQPAAGLPFVPTGDSQQLLPLTTDKATTTISPDSLQ